MVFLGNILRLSVHYEASKDTFTIRSLLYFRTFEIFEASSQPYFKSPLKWNTNKETDKSMKNALYILQYAKRHFRLKFTFRDIWYNWGIQHQYFWCRVHELAGQYIKLVYKKLGIFNQSRHHSGSIKGTETSWSSVLIKPQYHFLYDIVQYII